jgi:hypothetical protein
MTAFWFEPNACPESIKICNGFVAKLEKLQMASSVQLQCSFFRASGKWGNRVSSALHSACFNLRKAH